MSEEFLEESVVRPASDLFVWGNVSEEERMGKLLLAHPDANETERVELQRYNELFQRWYEKKGVRRGYIFDIAFRDGGVIPVVTLERMKAAVPYTMRATRRVIVMDPGTDVNFADLGTHIRNGSLRFQMLPTGTVVHLLVLTFWRLTRDHALIPHTMFPIGYSPRTYRLDYLDGHRPVWQLTLAGGPQQLSTVYQHYLSGLYRDGLYDPDLGYTRGLWTPENLIHRVLSEPHAPADTGYRLRHPFPASPRRLPDLPAYVDRRQAYHRKMFETLRDNMENGITHWATQVMLGIHPAKNSGRDPAVQSQIEELAREAREIIIAYRQFACPHFHVRSRFDAAFKAETRHSTFQIMSRFGQDRPDFRRQYHCTECSLALYCQHEELTQKKYANPLLDINLEPFYEIHDEIISCQYCRRFIGIKESETNVEFDENDRRISGRAVETDSDIRIREIITRVAQTLRIGNALSAGKSSSHSGQGPTKVKDDVLANYWLETLRPVIQVIYQEGKTKSKYPIGVYNLLIVLGYVVYSILVERTLPASLVVPGKGDVPNIETLIRATLDASSKSLYIHNILMQIPNAARREHFLKLIVEKYIWKILGEGATLSTQKRETVAIQRFFLEGIGGPTYGTFVKDNVDPADRESKNDRISEKTENRSRRIPRMYEFVHRRRVVPVDVPWKARIYGSMCYGDDGHWHDWDVNPRAANPMVAACAVCRVTIQQAFERFQKEDLATGSSHVLNLEASAMARHEFEKSVINCPRGGFHQIDLDVCLRCGQTLDEISARVTREMGEIKATKYTKDTRPAIISVKRKVNPGRVPGPPKKARVDDLENLMTAYVKILSRVAPTAIDQFKDAVTRVKVSPQFSGGFVDEFRMRMGARVKGPDQGQVYRTAREVAAAVLASCVESLTNDKPAMKELALDQVAFWRAAQGTVVAREYDEKFFQDRELDLEREQHERLLEFLSKTMDQKIADALLGDEVYDLDQPEYPEEPEDIDNDGELNGEDADREAT